MTSSVFEKSSIFARSLPTEIGHRAPHPRGRYDFGIAYPDPDSLPLADLAGATARALEQEGRDLALYLHPQGDEQLRAWTADRLVRRRGLSTDLDGVYLTEGSLRAVYDVSAVLLDPGDVILAEQFTYRGTLNIFRRFGADVRPIPCDDDGMLPEQVDAAIARAVAEGRTVKMIYSIPTFQNPLGWVMSLERRRALVEIARSHHLPILEDDCYVDLRYEGDEVASMSSMAPECVVYVGSYSKVIAPGMRMGYLAGPAALLDRVAAVRDGAGVNPYAAMTVRHFVTQGLEEHIEAANAVLAARRDAMVEALDEYFALFDGATWSRPQGGLFIWLQMPEGVDMQAVAPRAAEHEVLVLPGAPLSPDGSEGAGCARLCFGYCAPNEIREGIGILARVIANQ